MKLTLQLVFVVLNAPTKFRDNLLKFTLYTIKKKKMRPGHCTKKVHTGSPGVTFLGTDT